MTTETITLYYVPIESLNGVVYHETAVYTNYLGEHFYSEEVNTQPTRSTKLNTFDQVHNAVAAGIDVAADLGGPSAWGYLAAHTDVAFDPTDLDQDSPTTSVGVTQTATGVAYDSVVVASDTDLSSQWAAINSELNTIGGQHLEYSPLTQNSNDSMNNALASAGITPPYAGILSSHWAPALHGNEIVDCYTDTLGNPVLQIEDTDSSGNVVDTETWTNYSNDDNSYLAPWTGFNETIDDDTVATGWFTVLNSGEYNEEEIDYVEQISGPGELSETQSIQGTTQSFVASGLDSVALSNATLGSSDATVTLADDTQIIVNNSSSSANPFPNGGGLAANSGPGTGGSGYAALVASGFGYGEADPLVLDLSGDGIELTSLADSSAYFDLYGTSFAVHTGWVGPETGILVDSSDPTSIIDLFGSSSIDGFTALQALDSNYDGVIDSSDDGFSGLSVWVDANGDGVADSGEVQSLSSLDITSIQLSTTPVDENVNGNFIKEVATFTYSDDTTGQVAEAFFNNSEYISEYTDSFTINFAALTLPDLHGYGTLAPLFAAMSNDSTLLSLMQSFAGQDISNAADFENEVTDILYRWAGVDSVSPTSRGSYVDGQVLGVLEQFNGASYETVGGDTDPGNSYQATTINNAWKVLLDQSEARLVVQGPLAGLFSGLSYDYDTDSLSGSIDYDAIEAASPSGAFEAASFWNLVSVVDSCVNSTDAAFQDAFSAADLPFTLAQIQDGNYVFASGDGQVSVSEKTAPSGVLALMGDLTADDITLQANNAGDLTVTIAATGDSITLKNDLSFIVDGYAGSIYSVVSQIDFSDDTSFQLDEAGTPLNFTYTGTSGHTTLVGSDFGNNTFNLGVGGDTVTVGTAGNTFNFDEGDGQATVDTNGSLAASGVLNLGSDVSSSDVILQGDSAGDLTVLLSTGDSITFSNNFSYIIDGYVNSVYSVISEINFGDDTSLQLDEAGTPLNFTYTGTSGHTTLVGSDFGNNTFNLGVGGDTVTAGTAGNTFNFDEGDGQATVDTNGSLAASGVLNLGSDVSSSDVILQGDSAGDLTVLLSTGDSITFRIGEPTTVGIYCGTTQ